MFKGFQQTGKARITYAPSQMFQGFPSNNFAQSPNPWIVSDSISAWWDSQNGITLNSGITVSAWVDKISGITLSQATASKQPTYIAADGNIRNYPSLNNLSNINLAQLSAGNVLGIGGNMGQSMTFVINTNGYQNSGLWGKSNGSNMVAGGDWEFQYFNGAIFNYNDGVIVKSASAQQNAGFSGLSVYTLVIDRTNGFIYNYYNGNNAVSTAINTSATTFSSTTSFALNQFGGTTAGCYWMEYIQYNRALTAAEANQNYFAMKTKYGF